MKSYKTEGVIIKRTNFGEADKILTIFTKHFGKISVLAKGIRKTSSKKGGSLELFNQVGVFAAKGKNIDIVTEAEVINSFKEWRKDLRRVAVAYQFCELVDRLSAEEVENQEIYEILVNYLSNLSTIINPQLSIINFELSLLQSLGFWPKGRAIGGLNLDNFIENLINRRLNTKKFLKRISISD